MSKRNMRGWLSHPLLLVSAFCGVVVSGEHYGHFYAWFIWYGLRIGAVHAWMGILAVTLLTAVASMPGLARRKKIFGVLKMTGALLTLVSLVIFFANDTRGYNNGTFRQGIPVTSVIVWLVLAILAVLSVFRKDQQ